MKCGAPELIYILSEAAAGAPEIWRGSSRGLPLSNSFFGHCVGLAGVTRRRPELQVESRFNFVSFCWRPSGGACIEPPRSYAWSLGTQIFSFGEHCHERDCGENCNVGLESSSFFAALTPHTSHRVFPLGLRRRLKVLGRDFQLFFFVWPLANIRRMSRPGRGWGARKGAAATARHNPGQNFGLHTTQGSVASTGHSEEDRNDDRDDDGSDASLDIASPSPPAAPAAAALAAAPGALVRGSSGHSAGTRATLAVAAQARSDQYGARTGPRLGSRAVAEYTASGIDFPVSIRHRHGSRQAGVFVRGAERAGSMMRGLRPGLSGLPPSLVPDVARMLAVAFQAGLSMTTGWTAVEKASHAAAVIGPQLPPQAPRRRPHVTANRCLNDARHAVRQELDFGPRSKRLAIARDDSLQQLTRTLMRLRLHTRVLNDFKRHGTDPRGLVLRSGGHRICTEDMQSFLIVLGEPLIVSFLQRKREHAARRGRRAAAAPADERSELLASSEHFDGVVEGEGGAAVVAAIVGQFNAGAADGQGGGTAAAAEGAAAALLDAEPVDVVEPDVGAAPGAAGRRVLRKRRKTAASEGSPEHAPLAPSHAAAAAAAAPAAEAAELAEDDDDTDFSGSDDEGVSGGSHSDGSSDVTDTEAEEELTAVVQPGPEGLRVSSRSSRAQLGGLREMHVDGDVGPTASLTAMVTPFRPRGSKAKKKKKQPKAQKAKAGDAGSRGGRGRGRGGRGSRGGGRGGGAAGVPLAAESAGVAVAAAAVPVGVIPVATASGKRKRASSGGAARYELPAAEACALPPMGADPDDLPLGAAAFLAAAAAPPLSPAAVAIPAAVAPAVAVPPPAAAAAPAGGAAAAPPPAAPLAPIAEAPIPACFATLPPLKAARGERGAAASAKGGLSATYFTEGSHLTGHARISGDGNMASGASSGLRGVGERRSASAKQHPPSVLKVSVGCGAWPLT